MVISEVLRVNAAVEALRRVVERLDFIAGKNQPARFAPFSQSVDAVSLRVFETPPLHAPVIRGVYETVILECRVMREYVLGGGIEVFPFQPVRGADGVECEGYLIKEIGISQNPAETVVKDVDVAFVQLRSLFNPYPRQFSAWEGDRLDFLLLSEVLHAAEDNAVPRGVATDSHRVERDAPQDRGHCAAYPIYRAYEFREGAVLVGFSDFTDDKKVRALIPHVHELQDVILRHVDALSRARRAFQHTIALPALVDLPEYRVKSDGRGRQALRLLRSPRLCAAARC